MAGLASGEVLKYSALLQNLLYIDENCTTLGLCHLS